VKKYGLPIGTVLVDEPLELPETDYGEQKPLTIEFLDPILPTQVE